MKKINSDTGEVLTGKNTFACFRNFSADAEKDFDKYYIDRVIKQVVKKIGDGENDYVIEDKEVITKRDIAEVINAQNSDAGIEAFLQPYLTSGEKLPNVNVGDEIADYTKCPDTLADAIALGEEAKKKFNSLDPKLTKGMTPEEFIQSITQKAFNEYLASLTPKEEGEEK